MFKKTYLSSGEHRKKKKKNSQNNTRIFVLRLQFTKRNIILRLLILRLIILLNFNILCDYFVFIEKSHFNPSVIMLYYYCTGGQMTTGEQNKYNNSPSHDYGNYLSVIYKSIKQITLVIYQKKKKKCKLRYA